MTRSRRKSDSTREAGPDVLHASSSADERRSRWKTFAGLLGVCLWLIAPLGVAAWTAFSVTRADVVAERDAWISPVQGEGTQERSVGLQLSWREADQVFAPSWVGVVQAVHVQPGGSVASGGKLAMVDGIERLAVASPIPFTRALQEKDQGADVEALNEALRSMGFSASDSDRFTFRTLTGVRALAEAIGVASSAQLLQFDPNWFVFIPRQEIQVASVELSVGAPAPAAGTAVITTPRVLESASLIPTEQVPAEQASSDGGDAGVEPQPQIDPIAAESDETLVVGTSRLPLDESLTRISDEAIPDLQALVVTGTPFTRGALTRTIPEGQYRLPPSAIITQADGRTCVLRATEYDDDGEVVGFEPVDVEFVGSQGANTWVTGELALTDRIGVEPRAEDRSCRQ